MSQTSYKLITLSLIVLLTFFAGISYFQKIKSTELLSSRVDLLENKINQIKPTTDLDTSVQTNNELVNLQGRVSTLQTQLDRIDSYLVSNNNSQKVSKNEKATTTEPQVDIVNTNQRYELEVIDTIKNTGYLYEENWKELEPTLASMNKDENKQFWQSITSAIENREIELYSD